MKKKVTAGHDLRKRAEARLEQRGPRRAARDLGSERRLLHELEVHQVELEMQNDELRAARLATEAGLERYTLLFDYAPTGYAILAPGGAIREVNHHGAEILGVVRSSLTGQPFTVFVSTPERAAFAELLRRTSAGDTKETCELTLVNRDARPLTAHVTARALTREEPMVLLAFEDVSEQKRREEALARAEKTAREMDRRKDEFLAALSHELRNPLAPIRTSLFLLSRGHLGAERAAKVRGIIDRQVRLLTRLVEDLLDVTRVTRGKVELQRSVIDLAPVVHETIEDHRPGFEASGLALEARLARRRFCVDADAARLMQALSNLLMNAEKFTPRGGTVTVSLEPVGRREVSLRVRDTGVGVEPRLLPHLFEPFVQGHQTIDRSKGGVGLGLAMVKGLIELHGGSVRASSAGPGRGTEIEIRLPLAAGKGAEEPRAAGPADHQLRRVLVIEDNEDNAESLQSALELNGHQVRVALDGADGIELARGFEPDVIVSDIGLPRMDGYAVARAIRSDAALKDVYLVALSGYTGTKDVERSVDAGFDRHLGKPASLEQLDDLIRRAPPRRSRPPARPEPRSTPPH